MNFDVTSSRPTAAATTGHPVRVAHLIWRLSTTGGIQIVIRQLLAAEGLAHVDAHVLTVRPHDPSDHLEDVAATIHPLGIVGHPSFAKQVRAVVRAARIMRDLRPDVLHAHSGTALFTVAAATLARPRLRLLDVHDAPSHGRHSARTEWLEGAICRWLGFTTIVHSSSVAREVREVWRPRRAPVLIPLGVPTNAFAAPRVEPRGAQAATVLYVARLVPSKDVALLVRVAALVAEVPKLSGTRFVVVADGPERARLQEEIDGAGLRSVVTLEPARTGAALVATYRDADVFLSTSAYEGFGLAVVEAMAAGVPVVATAVGGVTDLVIDGETGLLAEAGDEAALARHVTALLLDPERAHRFGMAGRDRAQQHFDARSMAAGYQSLYARAGHSPLEVAVLKSSEFGSAGAGPPLPYRIDHLRERGIELRWTDRHRSAPLDRPRVARLVAASERRAAPWLQTALLLPELLGADATLAFFESEANAWATARRLLPRRRRKPMVVLTCWLADLLERHPDRARRYRAAYFEIDRIVFFSSNQGPILQRRLGLQPNRLRFVPFGVDDDWFRPLDEPDGGYVIAVGRDQGRDWQTFMAAAERSGLPVKVACRPSDLRGIAVPNNVEMLGYIEPERYRALLGRARLSVVPTVERAYPSGQTVALESMAMGRATVITETPAMADYLRPDVNALGVPMGDADTLAETMKAMFDDEALRTRLGQAGRLAVEERFNARTMWTEIGAVIVEAVADRAKARP